MNAAPVFPGDFNSEILTLTDILCVNEVEASLMTKLTVTTIDDANKALRALLAKGCATVIITLGENGAVCGSQNSPDIEHITTTKTTVVDTTVS